MAGGASNLGLRLIPFIPFCNQRDFYFTKLKAQLGILAACPPAPQGVQWPIGGLCGGAIKDPNTSLPPHQGVQLAIGEHMGGYKSFKCIFLRFLKKIFSVPYTTLTFHFTKYSYNMRVRVCNDGRDSPKKNTYNKKKKKMFHV